MVPVRRMSPSAYAKLHNLSMNYVYRLIRAGRLPCERIEGKLRYRITGELERRKPGPKGKG